MHNTRKSVVGDNLKRIGMRRLFVPLLAVFSCLALPAIAEERQRLGYGLLFVNDFIGDGEDRWRTGSAASSRVYGRGWSGELPSNLGDILELRFGAEIIAPEDLRTPTADDRLYAGSLSLGLHTHFQKAGWEMALGGDISLIGSQNGLDEFQSALHDLLGVDRPSDTVTDTQIGNRIVPTVVFETGRVFDIGVNSRIRPFLEARAGVETLVRAGFDLTIGRVGQGELWVRDSVTGHRYRAIKQATPGMALVLGADFTAVQDSEFLPETGGLERSDERSRVRAGVHWQGENAALFYGMTWLSEEFEAQDESQVLGAVQISLKF